jgi:hypothetical protein
MTENVNMIYANIGTHENWYVIEKYIEDRLFSKLPLKFISFCEMYFYKKGEVMETDWVGIIHDPHDTIKYYPSRSIIKNEKFIKSLPYCRGLFCMSNELQDWINVNLKPTFFVSVLYHPISNKDLKEFDIEKYKKDKSIIQIGNWLRKTYSIYLLNTNIKKKILPFNKRTINELKYFLKRDNITLKSQSIRTVKKCLHVSDEDYNNIFCNNIVFLDLYSSTANNVILECIKANNPIIINRLPAIERYLGIEYPLFYTNINEVTKMLKDDELIFKAHIYLKNMDKTIFTMDNMIKNINIDLEKI